MGRTKVYAEATGGAAAFVSPYDTIYLQGLIRPEAAKMGAVGEPAAFSDLAGESPLAALRAATEGRSVGRLLTALPAPILARRWVLRRFTGDIITAGKTDATAL